MKRKLISVILTIVMIVSLLPTEPVIAQDSLVATATVTSEKLSTSESDFDWNGDSIKGYNGTATEVVIPDRCTSIEGFAFYDNSEITSITIPNSVEGIGIVAFNGCSSLESVSIGYRVSSIDDKAFGRCSSLTNVRFVGNAPIMGDNVFVGCNPKLKINYDKSARGFATPKWQGVACYPIASTESTGMIPMGERDFFWDDSTIIGFNGGSVTDVIIPDRCTSIADDAFTHRKITSVTIPDSVLSIGDRAFDWCQKLTRVTIGNGVTSIGGAAFNNCVSLESLTMGNSVTNIGEEAFYGCPNLTSIDIPNSVTSIEATTFYGCERLARVTIGNSVTSIGEGAFNYCSSLTSVTIPNSVANIGEYAFYNCDKLGEIIVDSNNTNYTSIEGVLYTKDKTSILTYPAGRAGSAYILPNSVTSISNNAFTGCKKLVNISIPEGVTSIGAGSFLDCSSLASVTIPNSIRSISESAFSQCVNLTSVIFSGNAPELVVGVFNGGNPKLEISYNKSAIGFTTPKWQGVACYPIGTSTAEKEPIALIGISPKILTSESDFTWDGNTIDKYIGTASDVVIPDRATSIGDYAFRYASSLESVTMGNNVKSIGDRAFSECSSLERVVMGNSVMSIGDETFRGCTNLASIIIPNKVTSIGEKAFYECGSMTSVTFGKSVKNIGRQAFATCSKLASVIFYGNAPEFNSDELDGDEFAECHPDFKINFNKSAKGFTTPKFKNVPCYPIELKAPIKNPIAPTSLNLSIKGTEATLSWKAVQGATCYIVYYKKENEKYKMILVRTTKENIAGLEANSKYYFKVVAVNSVGEGKASAEVAKTTGAGK